MINEQLEKSLTKIVDQASDGISFLSDELPEVVQQLLAWKMVQSLGVFSLASFTLIAILWYVIKRSGRRKSTNVDGYQEFERTFTHNIRGEIDEGAAVVGIVLAVALISFSTVIFTNLDWLQIWIAPKVYLLEYAAKLVK